MSENGSRRSLEIHGSAVELQCTIPELEPSLDILLDRSAAGGPVHDDAPMGGSVFPFDPGYVLGSLPESARHVGQSREFADIYQDEDRFWLIDDRWGMTELHLGARQWRSWILPRPALDSLRVVERSVLWPMAQLMHGRGLHLAPVVSAVKDGFAVLILCRFGIEPELLAMISAGYKIIGQRWTALREEDGRLALLRMPGRSERFCAPRLRGAAETRETWIDLTEEHPGSRQNHAFCDAVMVIGQGRRLQARFAARSVSQGANLLREHWPIDLLLDENHAYELPERVSAHCRCFEVELSRNPKDLVSMLHSMRYSDPNIDQRSIAA